MGDKQAAEARDVDLPARHREHRQPARPYAVLVRLSEEERRLIVAAAGDARLTPTGFTAMAAVAAAGSAAGPAVGIAANLKELQRELFAARRAVNMLASNVNQAAAAYNSTGELPDWVQDAVRLCRVAVGRLDEITGRRSGLRPAGSPRTSAPKPWTGCNATGGRPGWRRPPTPPNCWANSSGKQPTPGPCPAPSPTDWLPHSGHRPPPNAARRTWTTRSLTTRPRPALTSTTRGRGLTYPLARAAIDFARGRGARAIEAYPMITQPGKVITWGELHVGARQVFEEAGFVEVSHPTLRRVVMRIDFASAG